MDFLTVKNGLHRPVDQLDEQAADGLLEYAQWLAAEEDDSLREDDADGRHQP